MSDEVVILDLPTLSAKVGQLIRSNELKMAGKLLATARSTLHQLAEKDASFQPYYEHIAKLRSQLQEPGQEEQFDEKRLLSELLAEEKQLHKLLAQHHGLEPLLLVDTLVKSAAAILLVYAQDMAAGAPLELTD